MIVRTHTDSVNNGIGCDDSCLVIFACDSYTILGDGNNLSAGNSCDILFGECLHHAFFVHPVRFRRNFVLHLDDGDSLSELGKEQAGFTADESAADDNDTIADDAEIRVDRCCVFNRNPAIADIPQNLHIGCLSSHPVSTGLVELAGDGKTAKGLWYAIAQETEAQPDGTGKALWMPEKIAVDFVKEEDGWKIWHIVVSTDLVSEAGEDYSEQEVYHNYETNPVDVEFGTPTIAKLIHNTDFNWWDNYPPMPEAYETFSDAVSYGPEGYVRPALYGLDSKEGRNFR